MQSPKFQFNSIGRSRKKEREKYKNICNLQYSQIHLSQHRKYGRQIFKYSSKLMTANMYTVISNDSSVPKKIYVFLPALGSKWCTRTRAAVSFMLIVLLQYAFLVHFITQSICKHRRIRRSTTTNHLHIVWSAETK